MSSDRNEPPIDSRSVHDLMTQIATLVADLDALPGVRVRVNIAVTVEKADAE